MLMLYIFSSCSFVSDIAMISGVFFTVKIKSFSGVASLLLSNMGTTVAEIQGAVAGLVRVVKDLTTNVNHITQTISNLAQVVPAASNSNNTQGLCMPSLQLPSFCRDSVVEDDISEFLKQFTQQTLHLPTKTHLPYNTLL